MLKKILILSVSLCLLTGTAYAGSLPKQNKEQIKQTQKYETKNKLTNKSVRYIRYAKLFSVELNYNTLSATLSYMPAYKFSVSGRLAKVVIRNVKTNLKSPVLLPVVNSNSILRADYRSVKHNLVITLLMRRRFNKNKIKAISEGHILVIKFPTLKNRPILSFPRPKQTNEQSYSVKNSKTVYVSLKNISMIMTPYPITKIIYSKDQNIEIMKSGDTAFVKILPLEEQKPSGRIKFLYNNSARDIYIVTPAGTYSLNLIPRRIPSLTVMLKNPQIPNNGMLAGGGKQPIFKQPALNPGINTNVSYYRSSVYTNKLVSLMKDAYFFKIPTGYSSFAIKKTYRFKQITIKGLNAYAGKNFIILIYKIKANMPVNLSEKEFLWMSPQPLAISIASPVLKQGENTRLFIVEANNGR
jgi:hypothetical protein